MEDRIFLESKRNKRAVNTSSGMKINMVGSRRLLPTTDFDADISEYGQYMDERCSSTKFRLTFQVNPICTNVLHNKITEIVKYEGSKDAVLVNYPETTTGSGIHDGAKTMDFYASNSFSYKQTSGSVTTRLTSPVEKHMTNAIRDMALSSDKFVYHCGSDIFNNHLLRSETFKVVCTSKNNGSDDFNTLADTMRDSDGNDIIETLTFPTSAGVPKNYKKVRLHLYEYDDVLSFNDCLSNRLKQSYNGWVGFENTSKIKTYEDFSENEELGVERPIMYMNGGDFVDMYPSRDLYSFIPKYNKFRHRLEKNWNYCLTYPSSSTTIGFDDIIDNRTNGLRVSLYSENTVAYNGTKQLAIYSVAKHGLKVGDVVNVYKGSEKVLDSAEVMGVVGDFNFYVFNPSSNISSAWTREEAMGSDEYSGYTASTGCYYDDDGNKYFSIDGWVNLDPDAQEISYKKVSKGIECEYYIRIFSRIPNFKYASASTYTEYDIYKDDAAVLKECQRVENDFSSQLSRLAFARNIYSDEIGQIVYTDDIDISKIKDNLGRPITSIYLTIVKNNKGYKQWYGFGNGDWKETEIRNDNVEFSHCFGKVTCGIDANPMSSNNSMVNNIHSINNANLPYGYDVSIINERSTDDEYPIDDNEIWYDTDINFYGDLVCYDSFYAREYTIQPILHRFNTAQRESTQSASGDYFKAFNYDEISNDDYDRNDKYVITSHPSSDFMEGRCNNLNEGYYYSPHYEIRLRQEGELMSVMPDFLPIRSMVSSEIGTTFNVSKYPYLSIGDKCMLYDKSNGKLYYCTVKSGSRGDLKTFTCDVTKENGDKADDIINITQSSTMEDKLRYKLFKVDNLEIPSYAKPMKDGTCRMIWRGIFNNGCGNYIEGDEYTFTNGAFYINKGINIYVRRQDPDGIYGLYSADDFIGEALDYESEDNYIKENDITC